MEPERWGWGWGGGVDGVHLFEAPGRAHYPGVVPASYPPYFPSVALHTLYLQQDGSSHLDLLKINLEIWRIGTPAGL